MEVQEQDVSKDAFIKLGDATLDLDSLARKIEDVFLPHGVRRVLRAHHDEQLPLYELHFTSEHTLGMFLKEKEEADHKLQDAIITSDTSGLLEIHTDLYLLVPQNGKQKTHLQLVTAENCKHIVKKCRESVCFTFKADLFKKCEG